MKITPDVLKPHPVLALLPYRTLKRLAADSSVREFPKGAVLFNQGETCDALYLIISGRCEARVAGHGGPSIVEAVFGPGDILGERAFLHAEPHSATMSVVTHCVLLRIPVEELDSILQKDPKLAARFSQVLAKRWSTIAATCVEKGSCVRRVVSLLTLNGDLNVGGLAESVAGVLSRMGRGRVLLVKLSRERSPVVHAWARRDPSFDCEFRFGRQIRSNLEGYDELDLPVGTDPYYRDAIAPLISHCGRHYEYVLFHGAVDLPAEVVQETTLQADLAYVLLESSNRDLYEFRLLLQALREYSSAALTHVRPVLFPAASQVVDGFHDAFRSLGKMASFVHRFPSSNPGSSADPGWRPHVGRLAREIARCRVGLALSSGGAKGLAHVGVIQVLEEHGIEVDVVAGSSMGAYVAAVWAMGRTGKDLEEVAREYEGRWGLRPLLDPVFPPRLGFIRTSRIGKRLRQILGDAHFGDLPTPLRIVATRLETLEAAVFSRGDVVNAVEASIAIPGICVPVDIEGETYVDGGVADPLPVDVLEEMGIERIIAVNAIPTADQLRCWLQAEKEAKASTKAHWSLGHFLNQHLNYFARGNVFDTMIQAFVGAQMLVAENATRRANVVLRPVDCDAWWHDFTHPGKYIALGRRVAEESLPQLLALAQPALSHEAPLVPSSTVAFPTALRAA